MVKKHRAAPEPPPNIYLGDWLELLGIGPSEAARIAGCSQSYISNISRGVKPNINVLFLLRISEAIGITVNDLYQRPPSHAQLEQVASYSTTARATLLNLRRRKP
jgi:transcriptional regulator with XRE-family HTH domain